MIRYVLVSGFLVLWGLTQTFGAEEQPGNVRMTASFRDGIDGYSGTNDSEIWALAPPTILDGNGNASTDADNDGGESQVLLRFDGIIGPEPGHVAPNAVVHSAQLLVNGWDFYVSEFDSIEQRPKLVIEYHLLGIDAGKSLMSPGDRPQSIVMNGKVESDLLA